MLDFLRRRWLRSAVTEATAVPEPIIPSNFVTRAEAARIFTELDGDRSTNWGWLEDGCHYRAEAASRKLTHIGIQHHKAWVLGWINEDGTRERPLTPYRQLIGEDLISWDFHVAPAVSIINEANQAQVAIMDPTLFDGYCSPLRWLRGMKTKKARFYLTHKDVFSYNALNGAWTYCPEEEKFQRIFLEYKTKEPTNFPRLSASESIKC